MRLLQRHSKGQVLVLLALTMIMLLAVIALALDIGRAYGVKAKLNAAVDAASYEAANALAEGNGEAGMKKKAEQVAQEFFAANYRLKFMGADPPVPAVTAERDTMGKWNVRVTATAEVPTYFAGLVGFRTLDVTAVSETVRGTLDMVLVLDTSKSMSINNQFDEVQKRAKDFITKFDEEDDRVGLVAFASGAAPVVSLCGGSNPDQNPGRNSMNCGRGFKRDTLNAAIGGLKPDGMTASEEGLKKALDQLRALKQNLASGHRAIVFFSDGAPNTLNGKFALTGGGHAEGNLYSGVYPADLPVYVYDSTKIAGEAAEYLNLIGLPETDLSGTVSTGSERRRLTKLIVPPHLKCDANAMARNMAENVAEMARKEGIAVYSIGLGAEMNISQMFDTTCSTSSEAGTLVLKRLANTPDSDTYDPSQPTGIFCLATDVAGLKQCFDRVASAILRITR
jgi:Flp pilus assembly protein TadG